MGNNRAGQIVHDWKKQQELIDEQIDEGGIMPRGRHGRETKGKGKRRQPREVPRYLPARKK